jgi:hypothetical protein
VVSKISYFNSYVRGGSRAEAEGCFLIDMYPEWMNHSLGGILVPGGYM